MAKTPRALTIDAFAFACCASSAAATVILPHVIGPQEAVAGNNVRWDELVSHSAFVLAFVGMALKNNDVGGGGTGEHIARARLCAARRRGAEFDLISPLRDDLSAEIKAVWHPIRPGTDVVLMLGIADTLVSEGLHDRGGALAAIPLCDR